MAVVAGSGRVAVDAGLSGLPRPCGRWLSWLACVGLLSVPVLLCGLPRLCGRWLSWRARGGLRSMVSGFAAFRVFAVDGCRGGLGEVCGRGPAGVAALRVF